MGRRCQTTAPAVGSFCFSDGVNAAFTVAASSAMALRFAGGVGISTAAPQAMLDVNGDMKVSSTATFSGAAIFAPQTKAQLEARTALIGEVFYCSDCSNSVRMVVGTTTLSGYDSFNGGTAWH